jgi:hypothetical protein
VREWVGEGEVAACVCRAVLNGSKNFKTRAGNETVWYAACNSANSCTLLRNPREQSSLQR